MSPRTLENEALKLPAKARAKLAQKLLLSLDSLSEQEIEALWAEEALRRNAEIKTGKVPAVPADKVIKQIKARLK
jgi:putative addiction module component (TIGR02574 family)